jgi:MFS family permease
VNDSKGPASSGLSLRTAFNTGAFWLLVGAIICIHTMMGVNQSQVPHIIDLGFSTGIAATILSINTSMSVAGTFFFGWLCDRIPVKMVNIIGQCLMALGILILLNISSNSPVWMIWLYCFVFGISLGNWMPTMSLLTSNTFGMASYGAIFGMFGLFQSISAAISPLVAGNIYDATGNYRLAFIIIIVTVVLAIPFIMGVRRPSSYQPLEAR